MKAYSREVIIGLSVLIAALVLFFGIDYLKGVNVFKAANYYYVSYTSVNGLTVSSPVTLNGFKVGQVRDIAYEYENPGHVKVELSLDKRLKVPAGSKAIIQTELLGTASVVLKLSDSGDYHEIGDVLLGETAPSMLDGVSEKLMPAVETVFPKVDSLLTSVNRLVSDSALIASVRRLDKITSNLEATTVYLNRTLATMPKTMNTVDGLAMNLDSITQNLAVVSEELKTLPLKETMDNVETITKNVNDLTTKMNSRDNNIGLLFNDRELYDHMNGIAGGLDTLVFDLKKNPKRYIPSIKVF